MSRRLLIIYFCFIAVEINCQVIHTDSSDTNNTKPDKVIYQDLDSVTVSNKSFSTRHAENTLLFPEDLFLLRLHSPYGNTITFYNDQSTLSTLSLTSSVEYRLSENNKELYNYFNSVYLQSKPTKLQEILGVVDFSGAVLLAGYHVWKYYIKKNK